MRDLYRRLRKLELQMVDLSSPVPGTKAWREDWEEKKRLTLADPTNGPLAGISLDIVDTLLASYPVRETE
jgi:hypothetical protein